MNEPPGKKKKHFVWVRDEANREFLCPLDALKDPEKATDAELKDCINVTALEEKLGEL